MKLSWGSVMSLFENKKLQFPAQKKWIKDLQVGEKVDAFYKVSGLEKKTKKDGNTYLAIQIMDKSGKIAAKIWSNADHYYAMLQEGGIYRFSGVVNEFMSQKEIRVEDVQAISAADEGIIQSDYTQQASFDTDGLFMEMIATLKQHITSPHVLQLIDLFSVTYGKRFSMHYGAQKIHHAYPGGLLEHTHTMMKIAIFCADLYHLDKEVLLTGVLFHDIGKIFEFDIEPTVNTTMEGGLLGHLVMGTEKFRELKNKIPGFPEELSCKILHLIISHHGEKEYGSPELPKTAEAFMLHYIDLMDSKLKIVAESVASAIPKGLFSEYIHVLDRRLFVPPKPENPVSDET